MKKIILSVLTVLTIFALAACGAQAPAPTATEPATATQAEATPTQPPAATDTVAAPTEAPATDTAVPVTEATDAPAASGISFANDIQPILGAKCAKCHGVEQVKEGLDVQTYDALMAGSFNGSVITPGNANDSLFVQLIVEGEMPNRGTKVTPEELQVIIDWVNQGALNN